MKQEAKTRGVTLKWMSSDKDFDRVKLSGDDGTIDDIARKYGRFLKRHKSLEVTDMGQHKTLQARKKDFPFDKDKGKEKDKPDEKLEGEEEIGKGKGPMTDLKPDLDHLPDNKDLAGGEELYGAQVVRRVHADHMHLLEEYDRLLEQLEDDSTRKLIHGILEAFDKTMSELEDHFTTHERYKDYPPLEGAMPANVGKGEGGEMPEEEMGDENEDEEHLEMPEDEALPDEEEEEEPTGEEALEGMETKTLRHKYIKALRKHIRGGFKDMGYPEGEGGGDMPSEMPSDDPMGGGEEEFHLAPHHHEAVRGAHKHLKAIGEAQDLDHDMRLEAHHHGRALEDITSQKNITGDMDWLNEEQTEQAHKAYCDLDEERKFLRKRFKQMHAEEESAHHGHRRGHKEMEEMDAEKKYLRKKWKELAIKVYQARKAFPEFDRMANRVNVTHPSSNAWVKPGEDDMPWTDGDSLVKDFPEMGKEQREIDLTCPNSPSDVIKVGHDDMPFDDGPHLIRGVKDADGMDMGGMNAGMPGAEGAAGMSSTKGWHKALKDAGAFLRNVAKAPEHSNELRSEALMHHKSLDPIVQQTEMANVTQPDSPTEVTPGSEPMQQFDDAGALGEKRHTRSGKKALPKQDAKKIAASIQKQRQVIAQRNKELAAMNNKVQQLLTKIPG